MQSTIEIIIILEARILYIIQCVWEVNEPRKSVFRSGTLNGKQTDRIFSKWQNLRYFYIFAIIYTYTRRSFSLIKCPIKTQYFYQCSFIFS